LWFHSSSVNTIDSFSNLFHATRTVLIVSILNKFNISSIYSGKTILVPQSICIDIDAQYFVSPKSFIENLILYEMLTISSKTQNLQLPIYHLHKVLEICLSAPTYFLVNTNIFKYLYEIKLFNIFIIMKIPTLPCLLLPLKFVYITSNC
jgi:hypothetical protein